MTNRIKMTLAGIGCGLAVTAAIAVSIGGQTTLNKAMTIPPTPTATVTLPQATKTLPQATKTITITKTAPTYLQCPGLSEDSCYPDYIGKGRWVLRQGERPMPKATKTGVTKRVPKATTPTVPSVCKHRSIITREMLQDCIALSGRAKVVAPGKYEIPAGEVLVRECTQQYTGAELGDCLKQ